jgi:chorismate--pyruvate lyase
VNRRSRLFRQPPRWTRAHHGRLLPTQPPAKILSWLFENGSLTQRLRRGCAGPFRVVVLGQGWIKPFAEESRALDLRAGQRAIVREVALQDGERPLVVARSVIPPKTLRGADRRLASLGNQPLGHILFADPRLRRHRLQLTRVAPPDWLPSPGLGPTPEQPVWGRRSLYALGPGHRLLVAEFFLPALFAPSTETRR